jgi:transposase
MRDLYRLTEARMERLRPFFAKSRGKPRVDDRRVLSGMIVINRNGMRWCDGEGRARRPFRGRPERGPWAAEDVCNRFVRRSRPGVFAGIVAEPARPGPEGETLMIGSAHRKVHRDESPQAVCATEPAPPRMRR